LLGYGVRMKESIINGIIYIFCLYWTLADELADIG